MISLSLPLRHLLSHLSFHLHRFFPKHHQFVVVKGFSTFQS
jgi:hypothetical protein